MIDSKPEWFDETTIVFRQVLDQVAINLNEIHNVHFSARYWNIFAGAWLQQFVDMVIMRLHDKEELNQVPATTLGTHPTASLRALSLSRSTMTMFVQTKK